MTPLRNVLLIAATATVLGCGIDRSESTPTPAPGSAAEESDDELRRRPSSFLSADWPEYVGANQGEEEEEEEEEEREIEEGDIYRVLGDGVVVALNTYRGLQVIDVRDPARPAIIGGLRVRGTPVEMYVDGTRAIVLMNDWFGYEARPGSLDLRARSGGAILLVDIADRAAPKLLAQQSVPGFIRTSRLARGPTGQALYLAATHTEQFPTPSGELEWRTESLVTSFDVGASALTRRSQLSLGGDVTAIHAEANVLLVARDPIQWTTPNGQVSLVDISSPDGTMVLRASVEVASHVRSQFQMDFRAGVLRVFSGPTFNDGSASFLETFDARDPAALKPIDREEFGVGQSLFGAVFLDQSAFAVTYLRTDPFHAFSIDPSGQIEEKSEFIVSGWNDFFRPVLSATRLIGIGVDDATGGRQLAVSLYDVTNLTNPNPLVARTVVSGNDRGWNWSEASWDHRAFTVLDDAVSVPAKTGETERGLVLLPFNSAHVVDGRERLTSAVQIFTYSATTLTRRGVMDHGSPVRRTFRLGGSTAANLSDTTLSVHDQTDLDAPKELGRVDLAPDFVGIYAFGDYRVRLRNPASWWEDFEAPDATILAEVIANVGSAELARPIAHFAVPRFAQWLQVGQQLVSVTTSYDRWPTIETTIESVDLSDPTKPKPAQKLVTTALPEAWGVYTDRFVPGIHATGQALTFLRAREVLAAPTRVRECFTFVTQLPECRWSEGADCTFFDGYRTCRKVGDAAEYCQGAITRCTRTAGKLACAPASTGPTGTDCYEYDGRRRHVVFELVPVELSSGPPAVRNAVTLPENEEGVSVLASGDALWIGVKQAAPSPDTRPRARHFLRQLDMQAPSNAALAPRVNVPGVLIDVAGRTILTRDPLWGEHLIETGWSRLALADGVAYQRNHYRFAGRAVDAIVVDEHELAIAVHDDPWSGGDRRLTVLSPPRGNGRDDFTILADRPLGGAWATPVLARHHRLLLDVDFGRLLVNLDDPRRPQAQAFFREPQGTPLFDRGELLMAAGRLGIQQMPLDRYELFPAPTAHRSPKRRHRERQRPPSVSHPPKPAAHPPKPAYPKG